MQEFDTTFLHYEKCKVMFHSYLLMYSQRDLDVIHYTLTFINKHSGHLSQAVRALDILTGVTDVSWPREPPSLNQNRDSVIFYL